MKISKKPAVCSASYYACHADVSGFGLLPGHKYRLALGGVHNELRRRRSRAMWTGAPNMPRGWLR